jgi:hypothetical protein
VGYAFPGIRRLKDERNVTRFFRFVLNSKFNSRPTVVFSIMGMVY